MWPLNIHVRAPFRQNKRVLGRLKSSKKHVWRFKTTKSLITLPKSFRMILEIIIYNTRYLSSDNFRFCTKNHVFSTTFADCPMRPLLMLFYAWTRSFEEPQIIRKLCPRLLGCETQELPQMYLTYPKWTKSILETILGPSFDFMFQPKIMIFSPF